MSAETYTVKYPFCRCKHAYYAEDGGGEIDSWRPGTSHGPPSPYSDTDLYADAEGTMTLTVIGRYKPAHYPERVFYTRQFMSPDGKAFGKPKLLIATAAKFNRISKRYGYPYRIEVTNEA